jgi:co-chaperonin GroES (HSP10)
MKATRNFYHINIDDKENWEITTKSGFKLFFDPEFDTVNNIIQYGKVINPPMSIDKRANMTIPKSGDTVYFHHHVFSNKIEFEEEYFRWATHDQLFFIIRDNDIIMLNDFVLVEPIETQAKTPSGILLESRAKKVEQRGILKAMPEHVLGADHNFLAIDDEIVFTKNSDYIMKVGDKEYYLMDIKDIIGPVIMPDGEEHVVPIFDWTIIEPLDEGDEYQEKNGILIQKRIKKEEKHRGLVHRTLDTTLGIKDGDKVIYDRRPFYSFLENNTKYYAVNTERDIFILL